MAFWGALLGGLGGSTIGGAAGSILGSGLGTMLGGVWGGHSKGIEARIYANYMSGRFQGQQHQDYLQGIHARGAVGGSGAPQLTPPGQAAAEMVNQRDIAGAGFQNQKEIALINAGASALQAMEGRGSPEAMASIMNQLGLNVKAENIFARGSQQIADTKQEEDRYLKREMFEWKKLTEKATYRSEAEKERFQNMFQNVTSWVWEWQTLKIITHSENNYFRAIYADDIVRYGASTAFWNLMHRYSNKIGETRANAHPQMQEQLRLLDESISKRRWDKFKEIMMSITGQNYQNEEWSILDGYEKLKKTYTDDNSKYKQNMIKFQQREETDKRNRN